MYLVSVKDNFVEPLFYFRSMLFKWILYSLFEITYDIKKNCIF